MKKCFNIIIVLACVFLTMYSCKNNKSNDSPQILTDTISTVNTPLSDTIVTMSNPVQDTFQKSGAISETKKSSEVSPSVPPKVLKTTTKKVEPGSPTPKINIVKTEPTPTPKPDKIDKKHGDFVVEEKPVEIKSGTASEVPKIIKPNHDLLNELMSKYVSTSGIVNYKVWKKNIASLNEYIGNMADIDVNNLKGNEKIAYCINVYNANTIKLVLDNYPVKSIQNIAGGKPWDVRVVKTGNSYYSLNEWENSVIRKMGEPRIHFVLNCAAKSCPPLHNQAFTTENLNTKLQSLTRKFVNSSENSIGEDKLVISKIFDWYKSDFGDSVIEFINKYVKSPSKSTAIVTFKDYNWSLNE